MPADWPTHPLGDLTVNHDSKRKPVKEADRRPGPYPYFGASGVVDYVDDYLIDGDYLLIAEDGENLRTRQTPIAFMARGKSWVNNHAHIVTGNAKADTLFLMYALRATDISGFLTGAVMPKLTQSNLNRIPIKCPELDEQRAIVHVLGSLDDKIELNHRKNETLETIARAIFKSWFVDFDPVRAKASGEQSESICRRLGLTSDLLALFPGRLVDSKLGEIPEGWAASTLGAICRRVAMGPFGSDIKTSNFVPAGVPVIRGANLGAGFVDDGFVFVTEAKADELRNANAREGDVVITHRGTLGQVGLIPPNATYRRYVVSQSQMVLTADSEGASPRFVYEFLRTSKGQQALLANTSQVGVPAIASPTKSIRAIELLVPPVGVQRAFDDIAGPLFVRAQCATKESRTIAAVRDALLAKLVSGELRVPLDGAQ
jgi:type I restriction enzyme, S subunit